MADIRYVVLSDLHFGAQNSVLTSVQEHAGAATLGTEFETHPDVASPLIAPLVDGLRSLVTGQTEPPTLVLAGDVLDLALSTDATACGAFERFVDLAFGPDQRVFAPIVHYLPGNHDHHLWETARETQYVEYLTHLDPSDPIGEPWHTTPLLAEKQPSSTRDLLSTLVRRRPGCSDVSVQVAYPNLALASPDRSKVRIISHGHFTEPIYMLMSSLKEILFPEQAPGPEGYTVARMEAENFAWIDFFWSTLGRSGEVGTDVGLVYADLSSSQDLNALAANLTRSVVRRGHAPSYLRPIESRILTAIAQREVRHLARSERGTPDVTLSPKSSEGAIKYLQGPVRQQIVTEIGSIGADIGFVFGHTHKPFVDRWTVPGYPQPVAVHNTGGWVIDTDVPALTQGGVAVLIDDDLNVASLQFYRQTADGGTSVPQVLDDAAGNPLGDRLRRAIRPGEAPWSEVTEVAAGLIAERHRLQSATEKYQATEPSKK